MANYYDVVVVGGGTSGFVAATAAARKGARTLLVERYGFVGGSSVSGFPFLGFYSGNGEKVVDGIPEEVVNRLIEAGGSRGHIRGGRWERAEEYEFSLTPYEPEILKFVAQEMLLESGANLMLHTYLIGTIVRDNRLIGIEVANKSGRSVIYANCFIDATGDADLAHLAGAPFQIGEQVQNVTLMFTVGGLDLERMVQEIETGGRIKGRGEWHTRVVRGPILDSDKPGVVHLAGHMDLWDDRPPLTFTAVSWKKNQASFNITRTVGIDPTSARDLVRAEISERRNVMETYRRFQERIPGMEGSELITTAPHVGVRESRRIEGEYCLQGDDVVNCREFEDGIARGSYPIDIHDPKGGKTQFTFLKDGGSYSIPYRSCIPKYIDGLIITGRCISATHEALGSTRLQSTCMALGQAAGVAASLCRPSKTPGDIDGVKLKELLRSDGAIV